MFVKNSFLIFLVLFVSNSILFGQTSKKPSFLIKADSINYYIELETLKQAMSFQDVPRTVPFNNERQELFSKQILKDSIIILPSFPPFYRPIETIDWAENPYKNDTWQLYYQNLFFVSVLNHAYYNTKNIDYHNKAKAYIASYIGLHKNLTVMSSKFSWYDHACAFRVLHMLQAVCNELSLESPNQNFIQSVFDHFESNIDFMMDKKNYSVHNHALMMDRTLLYLAKVLKSIPELSQKLKSSAANRAMDNFNKIIDDTGLAKEHSTSYHIFNHNLYKNIFELIGNDQMDVQTLSKYLKMNDVLLQLIKPDLTFPLWGDSQVEKLTHKLVEDFGGDRRLKSLFRQYDLTSNVNFNNNIAVLRTTTPDKGYLALFANYESKVHKHRDDLSFIFQTLGTDILTDQGYYGYDQKYRPLLMSSFSHNTVVVNSKEYIFDSLKEKAQITGYVRKPNVEIIEAKHNYYDSLEVKRKIVFLKPNIIIVSDQTDKKELTESLTQYFHFGESAQNASILGNEYSIEFPNNVNVTVLPVGEGVSLQETTSYRSKKPYDLAEIKQLSISKTNNNNLVTLIKIVSSDYKNPVTNVIIRDDTVFYTMDGIEKSIVIKHF